MSTTSSNTALLLSLIDEMEAHAIDSIRSKQNLSFFPSTLELQTYYSDMVGVGDSKLSNDSSIEQKKIENDLKKAVNPDVEKSTKEDQNDISNAINTFSKDKNHKAYFDRLDELEKKAIERSTKDLSNHFNRVRKLITESKNDDERNFIIKASETVVNAVQLVQKAIISAFHIAFKAIADAINLVINAIKNKFKEIYNSISLLLRLVH